MPSRHPRWISGALGVGAGLVLVAGTAGCSKDEAPTSQRKCAVLQADELSDLVGTDLTLKPALGDKRVCTFESENGQVVVSSTVDGPVEAGFPKLLLTDPEAIKGIGNEAWFSARDVPLDGRLFVRRGGTLWTIDLRQDGVPRRTIREQLVDIGKAGADELPATKAKKSTGARGEAACAPYVDNEDVAVALGDVPKATPVSPPGSCELSVAGEGLTVRVTPLIEDNATKDMLSGAVSQVEGPEEVEVAGAPAFWIPSTSAPGSGGQLNVLVGDRIVQVAVIGTDLEDDEAKDMAVAVGTAAVDAED